MLVSIGLRYLTPDVEAAGRQAVEVFDDHLVLAARDIPSTAAFAEIAFFLSFINPLVERGKDRSVVAEYSHKTGTYYAPAALSYADYVEPHWAVRIEGVYLAAVRALDAESKVVLPAQLKDELLAALRQARDASLRQASQIPEPLSSVWLCFTDDDPHPGVALQRPAHMAFGPWRFVEVPPSEVANVRARYFAAPEIPSMFKLYQTAEGGELHYREAWIDGEAVLEHWGVAGSSGETRQHDSSADRGVQLILAELEAAARQMGFDPIPIERHRCIVARSLIAGDGSDDDLDLRHELEEALNQALGWSGLGYCDGGDIGGGEMAVFSYVADLNLGLKVIGEVLSAPDFRRFRPEVRA